MIHTLALALLLAAPAVTPRVRPMKLGPTAPATRLSAAEQEALITAHNGVRQAVGVGPVTWDASVAAYAEGHVATLAAGCALQHSQSQYGENLAAWSGNDGVAKAVEMWADEKSKYTGNGGPFRQEDTVAGHYTQVVWRDSVRIGCAKVKCQANGFQMTLLSCNYAPRGNVLGTRVY